MADALIDALDVAAKDFRRLIQIRAGELPATVDDAQAALAAAGETYQRSGMLVRVARLPAAAAHQGIQRAAGSLVIMPLDVPYTRVALAVAARFEKYDGRAQDCRPCDVPKDLAASLLSAAGKWSSMPPLTGIIEAPTLRADGSVLDRPGYDLDSGLLYDPGSVEFWPIGRDPSRGECVTALDKILTIMEGFPFVDDAARSAAVSELLTPLVRRTLRAAPMFVNNAPKMSSGKSLLASCASYVTTGRAPAMMNQSHNEQEDNKRLLALLLEGPPLAVIDNVERELKSDALCSILTEPELDRTGAYQRRLHGNNVVIQGDLTSRVIMVTIDPGVERPEEREFKVNLHEEIPRRRGELVSAILTIIRGYLAAGAPAQNVPSFGRFEAWQQRCRYPLLWLGMADPCATRSIAESRDPVRDQLQELLEAWHAAFSDEGRTVAEAYRALNASMQQDVNGTAEIDSDRRTALYDSFRFVAIERGDVNLRRLGKFIAKHEKRIEGGLRFERTGECQRVVVWRVVSLKSSVSLPLRNAIKCHDSLVEGYGADSPNSPNSLASRDVPKSNGHAPAPAWQDDKAWLRRVPQTAGRQERLSFLHQWAAAAGGDVLDFGREPIVRLPAGTPNCLAVSEMRRFASGVGLGLEIGGGR